MGRTDGTMGRQGPGAETVLAGDPPVAVQLRPDARARRFSLRVAHGDGRVTLTFPPRAGRGAALEFMRQKEAWLRATLDGMPAPQPVRPGVVLPVLGSALTLVAAPLHRARREGALLLVPPGHGCGPATAAFLRAEAKARLDRLCPEHAAALGRTVTAIALRDTRSRWGSCTAAGRLMFSWRLAMAPPEVLDYVAAHEVAHLVEMNHSRAFWSLVARLCPEARTHRAWLRRHGAGLHRWRFDATAPG